MCHGSNNCYVRALDVSGKATKFLEDTSLVSAIANKRRSTSSKHENSDDEFLLLNEQVQAEGNAPHHQIQHNDETDAFSADSSNDGNMKEHGINDGNDNECHQCNMANASDDVNIANVSS